MKSFTPASSSLDPVIAWTLIGKSSIFDALLEAVTIISSSASWSWAITSRLGVAVSATADPKTKAFFTLELSSSKGGKPESILFISLLAELSTETYSIPLENSVKFTENMDF